MQAEQELISEEKLKPLLVVEDNPGLQKQLKWSFDGYQVDVAGNREEALASLKRSHAPVVTLDLGLPPDSANASEGFETLSEILAHNPQTKVIVVTGNDDRTNALKAISMGAYDFYQKPVDTEILRIIVDRAYNLYELEQENARLAELEQSSPLEGIIGASSKMQALFRLVEKVGPAEATSLIRGDSGTGKELIARALHRLSSRHLKPFVALNCAAIPENLLESELFGYEKGAFTGADKQTTGKIESANGGTFFLDEIGDMPLALQAKMLRFLQERVIERIGGRAPRPVDVRIICATHRDLEAAIDAGTFREDLYYRISEIVINVPALRDREGDKILLAKHFLQSFSYKRGSSFTGFTESALEKIDSFDWPGNVRELENRVKRAVVLAEDKQITDTDLGFVASADQPSLDLKEGRERVERELIQKALAIHDNNVTHAAEALGVSRPSLYSMIKKLKLPVPGQ